MEFSTSHQIPMSTHKVDISESTSSEKWSDIFKGQVGMEDSLWTEYLKRANSFDERTVDEWNKIVDVILIYVALFIAVLTSFVIETSKKFERDPAAITNDLLSAIYNQLANNTSMPIINTTSLFTQNKIDYDSAVTCNFLLYIGLALCTVVSVIALAAKLWLVSYSHRALDTVGTPYERAMKRQEAYNGVLAWKMGAVINALPLLLLIASIMFGFFVNISVSTVQRTIGFAVKTVLTLGLSPVGTVSLAAAFIPACPFHSSFSTFIQFCFELPLKLLPRTIKMGWTEVPQEKKVRYLQFTGLLAWIGSGIGLVYATLNNSSSVPVLFFILVAITFACWVRGEPKGHKPQKYWLPHLSLWSSFVIASIQSAAIYFDYSSKKKFIVIVLYLVVMLVLLVFGSMASRLAKSMAKTGEIDAIAWLLRSTSSQSRELFEKAGKIARSDDGAHKPRLLESLMPLLSSLIASYPTEMLDDDLQRENLETYVSCLALLSAFTEEKVSCVHLRLREDAKRHPRLEPSLRNKLLEFKSAEDSSNLKSAATAILKFYGLDDPGGERSKSQRRQVLGMTRPTEPAHLYEEVELHSRRTNGYSTVDEV